MIKTCRSQHDGIHAARPPHQHHRGAAGLSHTQGDSQVVFMKGLARLPPFDRFAAAGNAGAIGGGGEGCDKLLSLELKSGSRSTRNKQGCDTVQQSTFDAKCVESLEVCRKKEQF